MEIKQITSKEALKIIDTREPIGLFIVENKSSFTGIDNTNGDAWTEDFECRQKCVDWLNGEEEEDIDD